MKVEVKWSKHPNCYDLYVDGRLEIEGESFAIVDGVRSALIKGHVGAIMEYDEIAWSWENNRP
jgi:hypothetical protein